MRRDSVRVLMPTLGPPPGPLPIQRRIVFDKDAIRFSGALTLGEILRLIPGVAMVRVGWFGLPEAVMLAGQGAASVEIDWDGFPVDNIGLDSAGYDVSRFHIGFLDRIEVEVLPTVLRVHLVSEMTAIRRPRTEVAFSTGDVQTNAYRVRYLNRWGNGFGIGMGFGYFQTAGPLYSHADINELALWLRGGWMSGDRTGIEYQLTGYTYEREALQTQGGATLAGVDVRRTDSFLRAFTSSGPGGMGWRLDALLGSSQFSDTSGAIDARIGQASLVTGYRGLRGAAEIATRVRDGARPWEVTVRGSWSPLRPVTLSGSARRTTLLGGGDLTEAEGGAELRPFGALRLFGDLRWRHLDSSLAPVDSLGRVSDWNAGVGIVSSLLTADVSMQRHGAFVAPVFGALSGAVPVATSAPATTVTVAYALRPTSYLTLHGWYRHPTTGSAAFEPPHHALTKLTFRSRFLPHFRRGALDVMGQIELESWGDGIAGSDAFGQPIPLNGNSIVNAHVQFRLVGAILYWTWRNPQLRHYAVVPGFDMPRALQRFGIMWEFTN